MIPEVNIPNHTFRGTGGGGPYAGGGTHHHPFRRYVPGLFGGYAPESLRQRGLRRGRTALPAWNREWQARTGMASPPIRRALAGGGQGRYRIYYAPPGTPEIRRRNPCFWPDGHPAQTGRMAAGSARGKFAEFCQKALASFPFLSYTMSYIIKICGKRGTALRRPLSLGRTTPSAPYSIWTRTAAISDSGSVQREAGSGLG